ncbi:hypothetical protein M0813_13713 [Anaeramoeba flamelloides]|uniref:Integrase SAM-like N-terminal domain-containing protein n=1 Tax=Anaeramoeba flamelloides TaxID=1746091 RepID=A0ABQ8Z7S5_9EUKA|nr:hypothetical protein M0813_13713 [Anaeramoeba flamelloides]
MISILPLEICEALLLLKKTQPNSLFTKYKKVNMEGNHCSLGQSKQNLTIFLKSKPKPSWKRRIERFYQYNPEWIQGWRKGLSHELDGENCIKPPKIIVNKEVAKMYSQIITSNIESKAKKSYKSSLRGIEDYLKKHGYTRTQKYQREFLEFSLKKKN